MDRLRQRKDNQKQNIEKQNIEKYIEKQNVERQIEKQNIEKQGIEKQKQEDQSVQKQKEEDQKEEKQQEVIKNVDHLNEGKQNEENQIIDLLTKGIQCRISDPQEFRLSLAKCLEIIAGNYGRSTQDQSNEQKEENQPETEKKGKDEKEQEQEQEEQEQEIELPKRRGRRSNKKVKKNFRCPYCQFTTERMSQILKHGKQLHKKEFKQKQADELLLYILEQQKLDADFK